MAHSTGDPVLAKFPNGSVGANARGDDTARVAPSVDDSPRKPPVKGTINATRDIEETKQEANASLEKTPTKRTSPHSSSPMSAPAKKKKASDKSAALLDSSSPGLNNRPDAEPGSFLVTEEVSHGLWQAGSSTLKFGFLGLGNMGQAIVKKLLSSGRQVTVYNKTHSKGHDFVKAGALQKLTPADVVAHCDVTFCCVSDPAAAKEVVFGTDGVLRTINDNKGFVQMTSIDPETSTDLSNVILNYGGRYLEAPVSALKTSGEEGELTIIAAGDRSLFNDCANCFSAIGKHSVYLGEVGAASKMNLILNSVLGVTLAGLGEVMNLCPRVGVDKHQLLHILELSDLRSAIISQKARAMMQGTFATSMPLAHLQKDLQLAVSMANELAQPLTMAAAANEQFKHAKRLGYGQHDASAVCAQERHRATTDAGTETEAPTS